LEDSFLHSAHDIRMVGQLRAFLCIMPIRPGISQNVFVVVPRREILFEGSSTEHHVMAFYRPGFL